MPDPIVIVGAGQAGAKAAETLRRLGFDGSIQLFGDEPHEPYQRPPLSKKFLLGEIEASKLWLNGPGFYESQRIELLTGERILAIDPAAKRLQTALGRTLPYSKLLLATGSRPRVLPMPGHELSGVHVLRSIADVVALREATASPCRAVIVGGGYIGLEAAAIFRQMGHAATILEAQDRLLQRVAGSATSRFFHNLHAAKGVDIRLGATVQGIIGSGRAEGVELGDGTIPADLVLIAAGGVANDELASAAGLTVNDGIVVDETCRAGADIYAAGDCTRFFSRRYGRSIRLESVQNATDQARAAAASMLGAADVYDPVPWFWSDQYDVKLQIAGLSLGHDRTEVVGDPAAGSFSLNYYVGKRLICVDAINAARAHMVARRSIAEATATPGP